MLGFLDELYCVKYENNRTPNFCWYRGRIIKIVQKDQQKERLYKVLYIDYGNTQTVPKNRQEVHLFKKIYFKNIRFKVKHLIFLTKKIKLAIIQYTN